MKKTGGDLLIIFSHVEVFEPTILKIKANIGDADIGTGYKGRGYNGDIRDVLNIYSLYCSVLNIFLERF